MKKGFTLAEVLITLAIIGVIAAISVPSLIQKTNQAELITAWKKSFASVSQAVDKMVFDNGSMLGLCKDSSTTVNNFSNYLKTAKTCVTNASANGCWHKENELYLYNGNPTNWGTTGSAGFIMNNGTLVVFGWNDAECDGIRECAEMFVDVNGFKKPNTIGKDIFLFNIGKDGVVPRTDDDCNSTGAGIGCGVMYLYKDK